VLPPKVQEKFGGFPFREDVHDADGGSRLNLFPEEQVGPDLTNWITDQELAQLVYPKRQSWAHKSLLNESYMR
jgi:hypothetical protein